MPNPEHIFLLTVVIGAAFLFVTEKLRIDLAALCILVVLLVSGLIEPAQALYGFSNEATATVAAMFVISAGLVRTGIVDWLARRLNALAGTSERRLLLILCLSVALFSAFLVNTATVAIMIPVAVVLAKARRIAPSRVLIPLSFASQFGGVCTLIGTSTNILVNSLAVEHGLSRFHLFEFAPLGIILSIAGIAYLFIVSPYLIPKRKGADEQIDKYRLADYLAEMRVRKVSPLLGKRWHELGNTDLKDIDLIKIIRNGKATWRAKATMIREDDYLLLHGNAGDLLKMKDNYKLETKADAIIDDQKLKSDELELIEALVPPRSRLLGRTLRGADYMQRFGCVVLAIQRRGKILRDRLVDIVFDDGDTLLLECDKESVQKIMDSTDLVVTNELTDLHIRRDRALMSLSILLLVIMLAAFNIVPILVAAIIGSVGMVLGRCITIEEAYKAIDWKVIFLLGGILPLGLALQETGTAAWLVSTVLHPIINSGPYVILAAFYLITAVLTAFMSNNAAAVLLVPIALSAADISGISARPLLMAITFAASTSFATPIGYQTNTMIYAAGGYLFSDYARIGIPLNILFWLLTVFLIPLFWPL